MSAVRRLARSYLYVPGDRPEHLEKAHTRGADAMIADLEDAVGPHQKAGARDLVAAWLTTNPAGVAQRWVRVNAESLADDLAAVTLPALSGVVVPKSDPEQLASVDAMLTELEHARGLRPGSVAVLPLIESGSGLQQVARIAAARRVLRLGIGEVDLAADLGVSLDEERSVLGPLRLQVVVASAAAGIARPVGATSTAFRDLATFRRTGEVLRGLGFSARTAIHPAQVAVIHEVFTPGAAQVQAARDLIERFEAAGGGGAVDAQGRFIDRASVRSAREVLALHGE